MYFGELNAPKRLTCFLIFHESHADSGPKRGRCRAFPQKAAVENECPVWRIERVPRSAFRRRLVAGQGVRPAPDLSDVPARSAEISHWGASLYALPRPRHMSILRGPGRRGQFPAQTAPESLVSDIFREIDEEVRRERLRKLWDQYSNVLIAVALLIIIGIGGWRLYQWWETKQAAEAGRQFETAVLLSEQGKHDEAAAAFAKLAAEATGGYRTLARFRTAQELATRDPQAAAKAYAALAAGTVDRERPAVPPHGARALGAIRLARRRSGREPPLDRSHPDGCADA